MHDTDIRESILNAAAARFIHYGYSKTTIAEIASDCHMSVGNIYRFFENKEAIALAGVERKLTDKAEACERATASTSPAVEQLNQYMLARLRYTHQMSCGAHLFELVELITQKHGDLIQRFDVRAADHIAVILQHGMAQGELRTMDAQREAAAILLATTAFCVPIFMQEDLPVLEEKLNHVMALLYQGLKR